MVKIQIRCPSCSKLGNIDVIEETIKKTMRGILAVNVSDICPHTFIVYIDKNFKIRDYVMADFHIKIPENASNEAFPDLIAPEEVKVDLVKLNLTPKLIAYVLKSILYKKRVALISANYFLNDLFLNFFNYITQDSFSADISLISKKDYEIKKEKFKNYVVLEGNNIIKDNNKIINPKKLDIEKRIVQKFFEEIEPQSSLILLKNDLQKIYKFSKSIVNFIKNSDKKDILKSKQLIDYLKEIYKVKISKQYLNYLLEIVRNYFKVEIPSR
ncbi:MAG: hypothetical protein ACFFAN_10885 [Promethearchaeota archaeon]